MAVGINVPHPSGSWGYQGNSVPNWSEIMCGGSGNSGPGDFTTLEAQRQYKVINPGTFSGFYYNCSTFTAGGSVPIVFRNNAATKNQSVTITSVTFFQDQTHSDHAVLNDLVNTQITGAASGLASGQTFTMAFQPDNAATPCILTQLVDGANNTLIAADTFSCVAGQIQKSNGAGGNPARADCQWKVQTAGVIHNLSCLINQFVASPTGVITFQKNGSNGSQSVTPTSATFFQDVVNNDSIVVGDLINDLTHVSSGTLANFGTTWISTDFLPTNLAVPYISGNGPGIVFNANTTSYLCPSTRLKNLTTESQMATKLGVGLSASGFQAYATLNTSTGTTNVTMRKGQAAGHQSLTFTSGQTLWRNDADVTHTDYFTPSTDCDYQIVVPAGGTAITLSMIGFTATLGPPGFPAMLGD